MKDKDRLILSKILEYCDEIEETHLFFSNDRGLFCDKKRGFLYRNAVNMPILQIGELAKNLTEDFKKTHADIPWKSVTGIRDIFAHHYGSIDFEQTWKTSTVSIATLKIYLLKVRNEQGKGDEKNEQAE